MLPVTYEKDCRGCHPLSFEKTMPSVQVPHHLQPQAVREFLWGAYAVRNIRDEDEVISFGLFDMTIDQYRSWREEADAEENTRMDKLSAFVENEHVSGVYEVIEELEDEEEE